MSESNDAENKLILREFNETQPEHKWSHFVCDGPSHIPTFQVCLYIHNTCFEGYGSSKKKAKINAIQKFNNIHYNTSNSFIINDVPNNNKRKCIDNDSEGPSPKKLSIVNSTFTQISAISILYEMFPTEKFSFEYEESNKHGLMETFNVIISGKKYVGYGQNKREAKEVACRNALKTLYEENNIIDDKFVDEIKKFSTDYEDAKIIDNFANITNLQYQQLQFTYLQNKEYSVIASIIKVI